MLFNKKHKTLWLICGLLFVVACGKQESLNKNEMIEQSKPTVESSNYILGADISSLNELVDQGAVFIDTDGEEKTLPALLKNHGFNYIRLRTFVNPSADYGYAAGSCKRREPKAESYNDKAHIIALAQQVKALDMKLLLNFHYSDTWADPNHQVIPQAWRDLETIDELATAVKDYTIDVLTDMKAAGVIPDMVQVGNEITPGMLIHIPSKASVCDGDGDGPMLEPTVNGSTKNWQYLSSLLKAGIAGVKHVNSSTPIMLHIENTGNREGLIHWVTQAVEHNVKFDVLGLSAYEKWQGPSNQWQGTLNLLANTFTELDFSIVEYNPQRKLLNNLMYNLPNERGLGTFFWEPVLSGEWGSSMFTQEGNVYTAKPEDFQVYDNLIKAYKLKP